MADVRVDYTHKLPNHPDPHHRILGVAGTAGGGWYRTTDQVLNDIRTGLNSYFVMVNNQRADVVRGMHLGTPYIKTSSDGELRNNLLSLQEPPAGMIP